MTVLYGLKNCDTCRKVLKALHDIDFRDVRADGVPDSVLKSAYDVFGSSLINTRSTTWRELTAHEREKQPLDLLREHPTLMKRPLILRDGEFFLGWTGDVQAKLS